VAVSYTTVAFLIRAEAVNLCPFLFLKIKYFQRLFIDKPEIQRLPRPWKIIFQSKDFQRFPRGAGTLGGYKHPHLCTSNVNIIAFAFLGGS
jgi:hypothetical protein